MEILFNIIQLGLLFLIWQKLCQLYDVAKEDFWYLYMRDDAMENGNKLSSKLDNIEKMLWEDRKFLIRMMLKIDKITEFIENSIVIEENMFNVSGMRDEEKILKSIMEDLKDDIENKRDDFIKYHSMINSDQVGES